MYLILANVLRWILTKALLYGLVLAVLMGVFLAWKLPPLLVEDADNRLKDALEAVERVSERMSEAQAAVEERRRQAAAAAARLEEIRDRLARLEGLWTRLQARFSRSKREELEAERRSIAEAEAHAVAQLAAVEEEALAAESALAAIEEEERERAADAIRLEEELQRRRQQESDIRGLIGSGLRPAALAALAILATLIVVPVLWKLAAYYLWAPLVIRTRPVVVGRGGPGQELPLRMAQPAQRFTLGEGEAMLTKERYLQSSTEDARRATQWLLDWRSPLTSLASGLFLVTRIRTRPEESGPDCEVTLSCQANATEELTVATLEEGETLVLRPRFLAAAIFPEGSPPRFRARWIFTRLQSWITLQFRYLTVEGPATLVLAGQRGVQPERVLAGMRGRRINRNLTVGFSPSLAYRSLRAETFLAYFRGANPLFDDFFSGEGWTFNQQVAGQAGTAAGRFWEGLLQGIGKIFGL